MSRNISNIAHRTFNVFAHRFGLSNKGLGRYSPTVLRITSAPLLRTDITPIPEPTFELTTRDKVLIMFDQIIEDLARDEEEKETVTILKECRQNFESIGILVKDLSNPNSTTPNFHIPCCVVYTSKPLGSTPGELEKIELQLQTDTMDFFWANRNNHFLRTVLAECFLKEGTYIHEYINYLEQSQQVIRLASDFRSKCIQRLEKKGTDAAILKSAIVLIAGAIHQEFVGYKKAIEFLYRQGYNAYTLRAALVNRLVPEDKLSKDKLVTAIRDVSFIDQAGELDEKIYKRKIAAEDIFFSLIRNSSVFTNAPSQDSPCRNSVQSAFDLLMMCHPQYDPKKREVTVPKPDLLNWFIQLVNSENTSK